MKLKECSPQWPPSITAISSGGISGGGLVPDPEDTVFLVQKYTRATTDHFGAQLRNKNGNEYSIAVKVPEKLLDRASVLVASKLPVTLHELGELDV